MDLHHQPVFDAHARHLNQHVPGEAPGVLRGSLLAQGALEDTPGLFFIEDQGERRQSGVIGGSCPHLLEEAAPLLERLDVAIIRGDINA